MACFDDARLRALAAGEVEESEESAIRAHLRDCARCSRKLRQLEAGLADDDLRTMTIVPSTSAPRGDVVAQELGPAEKIGPYILLERLGEGGMGTVYAAYHPDLDRKVAIKLLRRELEGSEATARLLREAKAMARLDHPNVVGIHDVGQKDAKVFLVMDKVDGGTLKQWLEAKPRTWREILHAFVQAGRGLAAAHAAGMVHRDFKPANVLMSADGRARVTDFGLVRAADQPTEPLGEVAAGPAPRADPATSSTDSFLATFSSSLTHASHIVGTPRYMAPEQYVSAGDQRSDQFSFCVSLYEALYGQAPFEAGAVEASATYGAIAGATSFTSGEDEFVRPALKMRVPPKGRRVPRFVRRALARGLAQESSQRFHSMQELLRALSKDPLRRVAWIGAVAAGTAIVAIAVGAFSSARTARRAIAGCDDVGRELAQGWNDSQRQALRAAFEKAIPANAAAEAPAVIQSLDAFATSWTTVRSEACERVVAAQTDETALLELSCLGRQKTEFQAVVDTLVHADADVAGGARSLMGILVPPSRCTDTHLLVAQPKPPADPKVRAEVDGLRKVLSKAKVETIAGKPKEAAEILAPIVQRARELHYGPLEAEALYALGTAQSYQGDERLEAETQLKAENAAEAAGADIVAISAAAALAGDDADISRLEDAHRWLDRADALLARIGGDPEVEAEVERSAFWLGAVEGRDDDSLAHAKRAYDLLARALGPDHAHTLHYLGNLGIAYCSLHRYEEGFATLKQAIDAMTRTLGESSAIPYLAPLVTASTYTGRIDDADRFLATGLRLLDGPARATSVWYGGLLYAGSNLRREERRSEEALAMAEEAADFARRRLGPVSSLLAKSLAAKGGALVGAGRYAEAEATLSEALEAFRKLATPDADDPVQAMGDLAKTEIGLQRPQKAIPLVERALVLEGKHQPYLGQLAELRFTLARALVASGVEPERAAALAEQARAELAGLPWRRRTQDEVEAWQQAHPSP